MTLPLLLTLALSSASTAHLGNAYDLTPDITYLSVGGLNLQLDVYSPRGLRAPNKVLVYYHGGGWAGGTRARAVLRLLPYLEMGYTVVNATYRGAAAALAPAAVEDCRCVLRWVVDNADAYRFDVKRIVLTGDSAGSHLALMAGMATATAGFDGQCPGGELRPTAIVNWYGATDVTELLEGPHAQAFAIAWIGGREDAAAIARRVSPLTYLRPGLPAILTIHGEADAIVPLAQATRLHAGLSRQGVPNRLMTVPGGGHGGFTREQDERSFAAISAFLEKQLSSP